MTAVARPMVALRRPHAGYADPLTTVVNMALIPGAASVRARRPEPTISVRGFEWNRWTPVDLLLLPVALWLAAGSPAGDHRYHRGDVRRRGTWLRRPAAGGTR